MDSYNLITDSTSNSNSQPDALPKTIHVGIAKGRSFQTATSFSTQLMGLNPRLCEKGRSYQFEPDTLITPSGKTYNVQYVLLSPRDVGDYLQQGVVDMVISYDDTLHHMSQKNYHIKPLFPEVEFCPSILASLCLVGKEGTDLFNENNIICSEYIDAKKFQSSFQVLSDVKGKWIDSHGVSESMIVSGIANLAVVVVETGQTLCDNGLCILKTIRDLNLNIWCNADFPIGEELILEYRKDVQKVILEGNDGTGKTSIVSHFKQDKELKQFIFQDRGLLTQLTLQDYDVWNNTKLSPRETYIVLDCLERVSRHRIEHRNKKSGNDVSNIWENPRSLRYFRFKFKELCAHFGLPIFPTYFNDDDDDYFGIENCINSKYFKQVAANVKQYLLKQQTPVTKDDDKDEKNQNQYHVDDNSEIQTNMNLIMFPCISNFTQEQFDALTLVAKGESKIIRSWNDMFDIIQYIPSIYSHKKKRAGFIEGSDMERMSMTRYVLNLLNFELIRHSYIYVGSKFILAHKLRSPPPPIEIVVKSMFEGTDKYRYNGLQNVICRTPKFSTKSTHKSRYVVDPNTNKYPQSYVRFDWRNPNEFVEGDVAMSESLADNIINTGNARGLALQVYQSLNKHFHKFGVNIVDMCLFITTEGDCVFGEISQDNARYRRLENNESLCKDVFRMGGSHEDVMQKWCLMTQLVKTYTRNFFDNTYKKK